MTDDMAKRFLLLEQLPSYFLIAASILSATGSIIILLAFVYLCRINYFTKSNQKVVINNHADKKKNRLPVEVPRDNFLLKSSKPHDNSRG